MAGNVKGITIEFRGDTTKLDKALRQINNETRSIDKELKQVNNALKFNPTNVDLWRQKQQLLTQKIAETKEKLSLLKAEQQRMDAAGVDKNSEEYRKLQREIITTESQVKTFEAQLRKVGNVNLRAASESVKELGNKLTAAGQAMRQFSMAGAAVTAAMGAMTYKASATADEINTMSKVYGISTTDLQKYKLAADQVDVSVETIAKSHVRLEKQMYAAKGGTGAAAEAFETLGVQVTNADGSLREGDVVWQETIAALGKVENETERDALAMKLMGKSASELNPLIEDGGEAYKRLGELFEKYDLEFIDQETLDKANEFKDDIDDIKSMGSLAFEMLGARLAEYLLPAMEKVVDVVGRIVEWLANLNPKILAVIGAVAAVVAVLAPALMIAGKIAFAISSIMSLMATLGVTLAGLATPIGIVIAILAALVVAGVLLYKNWDKIKAKAKDIQKQLSKTFKAIKETILRVWNEIKKTTTAVWNAIKTVVSTVVQFIFTLIQARFNLIKTIITTVFNAIKTVITTAWNAIKTVTTTAITAIQTLITARFNLIKTTITTILNAIKSVVTTVWNAIRTAINTVVTAIQSSVTAKFQALQSTVTSIFNAIKSVASSAWNAVKSYIVNPIQSAYSSVSSIVNSLRSSISSAFSSIQSTASSVWNSIRNAMTSPIESARNTISGIVNGIKNLFPISIGNIFSNLKTPHFSLNWSSKDFGKLGTVRYPTGFGVSWYAKGGIFDSPTIYPIGIGEAGPEAVVPLDRFWEEIRNSNARTDQILAKQNQILIAMYEELQKEKNFKVDGIWAGRYVNSLVK